MTRVDIAIVTLGVLAAQAPTNGQSDLPGVELSGGATIIGLTTSDDAARTDISNSFDLYLRIDRGPGALVVYVEGNTTPRDRGVGFLVPESNADAGTALDEDGEGRFQISELKYAFSLAEDRTLDGGLLDVTAYLDTTRINNDENMQFLGTSFLNNPTIEFPDYTLGLVYHQEPRGRGPALSVALTSSEGLADHPDASYGELLELTRDGKGVFIGAEAGWQTQAQRYRVGGWVNTADHRNLEGSPGSDSNYGAYATIDGSRGRHAGNVRLGLAEESVSPTRAFASLTYQISWVKTVLGFGAARTWSSAELVGATPHTTHLEAYVRTSPVADLFVTPSIQVVRDSTFGLSGSGSDGALLVYALRLRARF